MTRTGNRGRGSGRWHGTGLSAHAPPEPIAWRKMRGRGAFWITCLPAPGPAVPGRDGTVPPQGAGPGVGAVAQGGRAADGHAAGGL